jgi:putative aminopeptidase FrvX
MLLKTLTEAFGVSGQEQEVASILREQVSPYCDKVETDALGNLVAIQRRQRERPQSHAVCTHGRDWANGHVYRKIGDSQV